jgi:hypothetical protein
VRLVYAELLKIRTAPRTTLGLVLGLVVTWEYRHGTITQAFLVTPRRERVIAAKYGTALVLGAALTVICLAIALVTASFLITIDLTRGQWEMVGRLVLGGALWGLLGAGLGAFLQSQVGAIVSVFVWFLLVENLIGVRYDHFVDYLPGRALQRLTERGEPTSFEEVGALSDYSFGLWTAALLAGAYAAALAVLGLVSAIWRDV